VQTGTVSFLRIWALAVISRAGSGVECSLVPRGKTLLLRFRTAPLLRRIHPPRPQRALPAVVLLALQATRSGSMRTD
jgi:hypothetical protein